MNLQQDFYNELNNYFTAPQFKTPQADTLESLAEEYKRIKNQEDALKEQKEAVKGKIIAIMDERKEDKVIAGAHKVSYTLVNQVSVDRKRLETEMPVIFMAYRKVTTYPRLTIA